MTHEEKDQSPRALVSSREVGEGFPSSRAYRVGGRRVGSSRGQSCCQHGQELQAVQLSALVIVVEGKEVEQD